jgi:uncharacterized protein (DUF1697 family)
MPTGHVALLRAISNTPMLPFRRAMEELGFTDVESHGMSGNLLFNSNISDQAKLERRISARLGTVALVRTRQEVARIVARDPIRSSILFLARAPAPARRRDFLRLDFEPPRPVLQGRTLFFVYPARVRGKRAPLDFERVLGIQATARSARIVDQILARMTGHASRRQRAVSTSRRPVPSSRRNV